MRIVPDLLTGCLCLCVPVVAQAVLQVGPSRTYTDLSAAIAAAAPGDRVLVDAGSYAAFTLDKGLLVRAEPVGAAVNILGGGQVNVEVPHGAFATIEGLAFASPIRVRRPGTSPRAGAVAFVAISAAAGIVLDTAELSIWRSQIGGFSNCIDIFGASTLGVSQSTITAPFGAWIPFNEGIRSAGQARIRVSASTITGGTAGFHNVVAASPGVQLTGSDRASFVDCAIGTFQQGILNRPALISSSSVPVLVERCTFTDNLGQGNATLGAVQNGLVLALTSTTPLLRGSTFQLDFRTRARLPVVVHARLGLDVSGSYPFLDGPDFGFVAGSVQFALLIADAQGHASVGVAVPNAPWLQDLPLWFAGWSELAMPVQMSPVVGGAIR